MRILVVTLLYAPDGGPSASLFAMLCENLVKLGHQVTIISSVPHYPTGQVNKAYRSKWIQRSIENNVRVIRVRVPSVKRSVLWQRLVQFLIFQFGATYAGLGEQYEVTLITNPAIEIALPFLFLSALRHKATVFFVADVYPDVGIQLGIFRHRIVIALVNAAEQFCLHKADYVWIFSEAFRIGMNRMGVPDERLVVIYSWVDTEFIQPKPRHNLFSEEYDLNNCFTVLYAGNLGLSQEWDTVLDAAQKVQEHNSIRFVFVGDGTGRTSLMTKTSEMRLKNVQFIPFQPQSRIPEVLATADIALVSLQSGITSGSIPSKTFSYLASGRPILALVDKGSDVCILLQKTNSGVCISPNNPDTLVESILKLVGSSELREQMASNGRTYVEQHHSPQKAAKKVEALLIKAVNQRQNQKHV
ncbi:MAG: glycosyltransferase family 4 protein [Anaerolineae bacterium]|nr:glycosyltransferase family 4 protein [Anaerolineae bacterium]